MQVLCITLGFLSHYPCRDAVQCQCLVVFTNVLDVDVLDSNVLDDDVMVDLGTIFLDLLVLVLLQLLLNDDVLTLPGLDHSSRLTSLNSLDSYLNSCFVSLNYVILSFVDLDDVILVLLALDYFVLVDVVFSLLALKSVIMQRRAVVGYPDGGLHASSAAVATYSTQEIVAARAGGSLREGITICLTRCKMFKSHA